MSVGLKNILSVKERSNFHLYRSLGKFLKCSSNYIIRAFIHFNGYNGLMNAFSNTCTFLILIYLLKIR